jgi:hypothetical protein
VAEWGRSGAAAIAPQMRGGGQLQAGFQAAMGEHGQLQAGFQATTWNGSRSIDRGPRMGRDGAARKAFVRPAWVSTARFVAVRGCEFCILIAHTAAPQSSASRRSVHPPPAALLSSTSRRRRWLDTGLHGSDSKDESEAQRRRAKKMRLTRARTFNSG